MTRHTHDDGQVVEGTVDYDYVVHHDDADPGLLVVKDVPAQVCLACDEYWFDDAIGFELLRLMQDHRPEPGEVRTIAWPRVDAA